MFLTKFRFIFSIACLLLAAAAFSAQDKTDDKVKIVKDQPPKLKPADDGRYRINPGDVFEVKYRYTPEFNQTVKVQPDGFVTLEIVGDLEVADLSLPEIKKAILKKASVRLKDPEITILLKEFQQPYFVVAGEVSQPGRFDMNEPTTALQAVLLAGGFKNTAKSSQIVVYRRINKQTAEVRMLDLKKIRENADLENDFPLEAGDMILVPQNKITKVERYVRFASLGSIFNPFIRLFDNN